MKTTHPDADLKSRHVTPVDGNVFADLGFSPKEAKALLEDADARIAKAQRLKEEAATAIAQWIQAKKLTQVAASEILDVSRPHFRFALQSRSSTRLRNRPNCRD